ncbi:MAG: 50S ribosomal protein L35 [Candidatus Anoxychlamydiales bacterium]|nr:50S ribosomal protein L35 [Candidatus Anoxychlamydiales bacterium]NGX36614.1 50S ribosomal protein L35 [Candidatus Anoxychlamydiales bacterium]
MPKMKTNKAVQSRFKVTGKNKLKRTKPGRRHLLCKKSSKRKRHLKKQTLVNKAQLKTYSRLLGLV